MKKVDVEEKKSEEVENAVISEAQELISSENTLNKVEKECILESQIKEEQQQILSEFIIEDDIKSTQEISHQSIAEEVKEKEEEIQI